MALLTWHCVEVAAKTKEKHTEAQRCSLFLGGLAYRRITLRCPGEGFPADPTLLPARCRRQRQAAQAGA